MPYVHKHTYTTRTYHTYHTYTNTHTSHIPHTYTNMHTSHTYITPIYIYHTYTYTNTHNFLIKRHTAIDEYPLGLSNYLYQGKRFKTIK